MTDGPIQVADNGELAGVEYFPDGRIVPPFLTSQEVIELLRLNILTRGGESIRRTPAAGQSSLDHLCRQRKLIPRKLARCRVFIREEVLAMVRDTMQRPK